MVNKSRDPEPKDSTRSVSSKQLSSGCFAFVLCKWFRSVNFEILDAVCLFCLLTEETGANVWVFCNQ